MTLLDQVTHRLSTAAVRLTIVEKLIAGCVCLAALITLSLAISLASIRQHRDFQRLADISTRAALNVERINGLIYAVVMESRGIYMSRDPAAARRFADGLIRFNEQIAQLVTEWEQIVLDDDAGQFEAFKERINQFQQFRAELVRRTLELGSAAGREWGDTNDNRAARAKLNADLEALGHIYAMRADEIARLSLQGQSSAMLLTIISSLTLTLLIVGAGLIWCSFVRPIGHITVATRRISDGQLDRRIPYLARQDEIGSLARALEIFKKSMLQNLELGRRTAEQAIATDRDREQFQQELRRQQYFIDAALNNMAQGLTMLDLSARLVFYNRQFLQLHGLSPDIVKPGVAFDELLNRQIEFGSSARNVNELRRAIAGMMTEKQPTTSELELDDGRIIQILNRPLTVGGWVATYEDVTERRRAERALDRTEYLLVTILENVPGAIIVKDARELRYIFINRAGETLFGIPRSEIIGKRAHQIFPKATADSIEAHDAKLIETNQGFVIGDHPIDTPARQRRMVTIRRLPIGADAEGTPRYLLTVMEDTTERQQSAA